MIKSLYSYTMHQSDRVDAFVSINLIRSCNDNNLLKMPLAKS